ncbi:MAG: RNA polymerase sigma factor [Prevotellaceae bacterium]|nr:RNA polymerase sigma factor [Candidatus Minthosoma caballi]
MIRLLHRKKDEGNRALFVEAVNAYSEPLYWHARRMVVVHEDAEDVVQNTFANAWKHIDTLQDSNAMRAWLYRIATREAMTLLSKRVEKPEDEKQMAFYLGNKFEEEHVASGDELVAQLQRAILQLTDCQRTIFNLRYYDELSYKEIAEIVGVAESTAKVHFRNARMRIEEMMMG